MVGRARRYGCRPHEAEVASGGVRAHAVVCARRALVLQMCKKKMLAGRGVAWERSTGVGQVAWDVAARARGHGGLTFKRTIFQEMLLMKVAIMFLKNLEPCGSVIMMTLLTAVAMVDGGVTACIIIANSISATCMIMLRIWLHMMFSMFSVLSKSAMTARVACECGSAARARRVRGAGSWLAQREKKWQACNTGATRVAKRARRHYNGVKK